MWIRKAELRDVAEIVRLWNEGVVDQNTFEKETRSEADVVLWMQQGLTLLVAGQPGEVIGFALAWPSAYKVGACWVMVARGFRRQGVGRTLLNALIREAPDQGFARLKGAVITKQIAGLALATGSGFHSIGKLNHQTGSQGVWQDVMVVERMLPECRQAFRVRAMN